MGQVNLNERLSDTRVRLERQRNRAPEPVPKFLSLTRKETRVREDQYTELTALTRSLMRDRVSRRERITENTSFASPSISSSRIGTSSVARTWTNSGVR